MSRRHLSILVLAVSICLTGMYDSILASEGSNASQVFVRPPPTNQFIRNVQSLRDESHVREALQEREKILRDDPDNHELLLEAAYLSYRLGWLFAEKQEKKKCYLKFYDYATRACALAPHDYRSLLLLAVSKAKIVDYLSHEDQVRIARELADDTQALVKSKEDDPDPVYLLSWLNFEIGRVSPVKKVLAEVLFGGLPQGLSVENAFTLMDKAIQCRPDYLVYQYDLGYFYLKTGVKDKARLQFEQVLAKRAETAEEIVYQRRAAAKISEITNLVN